MTYNQSVATVLTPLTEYLATSYSPDREYVDGRVVERAVGEKQHSKLQAALTAFFYNAGPRLGISVYPEQRVQVKPQRFRVPDVSVCLGEPDEEIFTSPPFLVIEILSPDDRMTEMLEKIGDYLSFGVRYVWVFDPYARRVIAYTDKGSQDVRAGVLHTQDPDLAVTIEEIFK